MSVQPRRRSKRLANRSQATRAPESDSEVEEEPATVPAALSVAHTTRVSDNQSTTQDRDVEISSTKVNDAPVIRKRITIDAFADQSDDEHDDDYTLDGISEKSGADCRRQLFPPSERAKFWVIIVAISILLTASLVAQQTPFAGVYLKLIEPPADPSSAGLHRVSLDALVATLLIALGSGMMVSVRSG